MAAVLRGEHYEITDVAKQFDVDVDEIASLAARGKRLWLDDLCRHFAIDTIVESAVDAKIIRGTPDAWCLADDDHGAVVRILDWKCGYKQTSAREQVRGYAYAIGAQPEIGGVLRTEAWVVYLRLGVIERYDFSADDVASLADDYARWLADAGHVWAPGEHCGYCPHRYRCRALDDYLSATTTAITGHRSAEVSRDKLAELYPAAQALRKMLDEYYSALRAACADGPLPLGDGRIVQLADRKRDTIDVRRAWTVLSSLGWQTPEILSCLRASKTDIMDTAASRATGTKTAAKDAVITALEAADAIESTFSQTLETRRLQ